MCVYTQLPKSSRAQRACTVPRKGRPRSCSAFAKQKAAPAKRHGSRRFVVCVAGRARECSCSPADSAMAGLQCRHGTSNSHSGFLSIFVVGLFWTSFVLGSSVWVSFTQSFTQQQPRHVLPFMTHSHHLRFSATSSDDAGSKAVLQEPSCMNQTMLLQADDRCITFCAGPHCLSGLSLEDASRSTTVLSSASASTGTVAFQGVPNSDTYTQACLPTGDVVRRLAAPGHHAWALDQHLPKQSFHIAAHTGGASSHLEAASRHTMCFSSESLAAYAVVLPGISNSGPPDIQAKHRSPHIHTRLFVDCALQAMTALENHAWHLRQRASTSSGLCPPIATGTTHEMRPSPEDASRRLGLSHSYSGDERPCCCCQEGSLHAESLFAGCTRDLLENHMLLPHVSHLCLGVAPRPIITILSPARTFTRAATLLNIQGSGAHSQHTCTLDPGLEDASRTMLAMIQQWLHAYASDSLVWTGTANNHPCTPILKTNCTTPDPPEFKSHTSALQAVADEEGPFSTSDHAVQLLYLTLEGVVMCLPTRPEGATALDLPYWNLVCEGSHQMEMREPTPLRRTVQPPKSSAERNNAIMLTSLGSAVHTDMYASISTCCELSCMQLYMFLQRSCSHTFGNKLACLVFARECTHTLMHPIIHHVLTHHSDHPPRAIPACSLSHLSGPLTMTKWTPSRQKSQKQRAREARRPSRHERLGLPKPPPRHTMHHPPAAALQPTPPPLLSRIAHPTRQPPPPPPPPNRASRDGTTQPHQHTTTAPHRRPRTPPPARREKHERTQNIGAQHRPPLTSPPTTEHMPENVTITTMPLRSALPLGAVDDSATEYSSDMSDDSSDLTTLTPLPREVSRPCPAGLPNMNASAHPLIYPPHCSGAHQMDQPCTRRSCLNRDHCACTVLAWEGLLLTLLCIQMWHLHGRTTAFFGCFLSSFEWRVWTHRTSGQWTVTRVIPGTYRRRWRRLKTAPGCHCSALAFTDLACLGCSIHVLSHSLPQHSWHLLGLLLCLLGIVLLRQRSAAQRLHPRHLLFPSPPRCEPTLPSTSTSLQGLPLLPVCPRRPRHARPIAHVCLPPNYLPPGLSLYAPGMSATQTNPTALLHIRRNLHWTGRPGPKSGTDLTDANQSEPQLTQVRGVRVASMSHSTLKSDRLHHPLFPEQPRQEPFCRYTCTHCCSTRRNPSPHVRIIGPSRLMFMLLCLLITHFIPHVRGAPTSPEQTRTWQHKRAYRRARTRASQNGVTWYRGRWHTSATLGSGPASHGTHPTPTSRSSQRVPPSHKRRLRVFTFNTGILSTDAYDELLNWLQTKPDEWDVICLQETGWKLDTEYTSGPWRVIASHHPKQKNSGVITMVSTRLVAAENIRHAAILQGRLLHVKLEFPPLLSGTGGFQA